MPVPQHCSNVYIVWDQPITAGWVDVPSAVTVTSISCSGVNDSIISESDSPVAPSVTVCEPPDGALTISLVPGERKRRGSKYK